MQQMLGDFAMGISIWAFFNVISMRAKSAIYVSDLCDLAAVGDDTREKKKLKKQPTIGSFGHKQ